MIFFFFYSYSCEEVEAWEIAKPRPVWVPVGRKGCEDMRAKGPGGTEAWKGIEGIPSCRGAGWPEVQDRGGRGRLAGTSWEESPGVPGQSLLTPGVRLWQEDSSCSRPSVAHSLARWVVPWPARTPSPPPFP